MAANMDSSKPPCGVYKNPRFMHACTTIVGFTVHLQTTTGEVYEGIFNTFSPEFTICLDLAVRIDPKSSNSKDCLYNALKSGARASQTFFDLKDIVRITAVDVDLNYATKDSAKFTTDAEVSGYDANKTGEHRQLESWQDDDGDVTNVDSMMSLDDVATGEKSDSQANSHVWDPQEMFRFNERVHKVTSTYDENLTDYTLPLARQGTKEWRRKLERAEAIANEIEGNTKSQGRLAKEDGSDCEEEKFSAVLRPTPNPPPAATRPAPTFANKAQQHHAPDANEKGQQQQAQQGPQQPQQENKQPGSKVSGNSGASESQQSSAQSQQQPHHQHQVPPPQQHQQPHQHPQQHQHQHQSYQQQQHRPSPTRQSHKDEDNKYNPMHRGMQNRLNSGNQNGNHKGSYAHRPQRFNERGARMDSLKNFSRSLNIGPSRPQNQNQNMNQVQNQTHNSPNNQSHQPPQPAQSQQLPQPKQQQLPPPSQQQPPQPSPQSQQSPQQSQQQQAQHQPHQPAQQQQQQQQQPQAAQSVPQQQSTATQPSQAPSSASAPVPASGPASAPAPTPAPAQAQAQAQATTTTTTASPSTTTATSTVNTSTISERSDTSGLSSNQAKDHQSELARKSTLNPNAKEFVYKPRSHATNPGAQTNGANQAGGAAVIDPVNSSPMSQAAHAPYYQQVPMFPHGLSPHQQQHHAAQFMPNHAHPHFQNQIHYMSPVPPHFAQQMSQRYIRGNFQNYHHRGEHHNNVRPDYSQASMMAPTSTGQPFAPPPSGAPHPMNAYAASPQQPMIYSGPPQSMYPVVPAGFPQHMPHVMPNPPPYDGSTVYMPSQNYIVNP